MDIFEKTAQLKEKLSADGQDSTGLETVLALYYNVLDVQPKRPKWPARDRVFLSAEELRPLLLAVLADRGYFTWEALREQSAEALPGAEGLCACSAESALNEAARAKEAGEEHRVLAILSDADCRWGSTWECADKAASLGLSRLCYVLLRKKGGIDNICARFSAFGFSTCSVDGKNIEAVTVAMEAFSASKKPVFICCNL